MPTVAQPTPDPFDEFTVVTEEALNARLRVIEILLDRLNCQRQNCHLTRPDCPDRWCRVCLLSLVERVRSNPSVGPLVRQFEKGSLRTGFW